MRRPGAIIVGLAAGFVGGVYVGLPAVLAVACRLRPRPLQLTASRPGSVSVVIAAHDEEASITRKLDDIAGQEFRRTAEVEVIVASDGSNDATVDLAREHRLGPTVFDLPRGGKATAMNRALEVASGGVVIFTDANSRLEPETFDRLLGPFADPEVGGVAGDQRYDVRPSGTATGERDYWSYERLLKRLESCVGNVVSSTGTLHAVRRELVDEIPGDVTDDFFVSTGVISRGRRLVFAADAVAWEAPNDGAGAEYRRRVRIITRGLTAIRRRRELLDPRRTGWYAPTLFVHKIARRLVFVAMVAAAIGSWCERRRHPFWRVAVAAQGVFYALAGLATVSPETPLGRHRLLALPAHFCQANVAAAHAVVNVISSRRYVTWTPERS